jgi:hypothetical protein
MTQDRLEKARGAVLIEFSIIAIFMFSIILFMADAALVLCHYGLLTHSTAKAAREVAVILGSRWREIPSNASCAQVATFANSSILLAGPRDLLANNGFPSFAIQVQPGTPYPTVTIRADWDLYCSSCSFFSPGSQLHSKSTQPIEKELNCT